MMAAAGYVVVALALISAALAVFGGVRRRIFEGRHLRERTRRFEEESRLRLAAARSEHDRVKLSWPGMRKFVVMRTEHEADSVRSIYLKPHDGRPLPPYEPGQYLTFSLRMPGRTKPVVRCYSLSDAPGNQDWYRITVKKLGPSPGQPASPPGLASSWLHDRVKEGDILDVQAPRGSFCLDQSRRMPVVLLGGGIGLTPLLSMLNAICASTLPRETWFFYGVTHRGAHPMREQMERIRRDFALVNVVVCYSHPTSRCVAGRDYDHEGFVSVELMKRLLPSNNYDYYVCGPPPMMQTITRDLRDWGVPDHKVHFEAFGPSAVKGQRTGAARADGDKVVDVVFARSGKTCKWKAEDGSLLELAEMNGVPVESGCRVGNCGTCLIAVKKGKVSYQVTPGVGVEDESCLLCIAEPAEAVVLDA